MEKYDYLEAVKSDVLEYIKEHEIHVTKYNINKVRSNLYYTCSGEADITGACEYYSSYTRDSLKAQENLCYNWDLLYSALREFGYMNINPIEKGAEWCDSLIRCYLLDNAIDLALNQIINSEFDK